ncbi:MAG: UDP-3-O-acyl-N-acetylglucosamine deacetylase [Desulfoferrobacter sp.]
MNQGFLRQHTIKREVWCRGVGLHSGTKVSMKLKPAPPNYGYRFCRVDIPDYPIITAHHHQVVDTLFATTIGFNGVVVSTVEHLLATFFGSRIDNVIVELDGPEVPIFDGSAATYLQLLERAGLQEQSAPRNYLKIERPILVKEGDSFIKASPADCFRVHYLIDFSHPLVGRQEYSWSFSEKSFAREIAKARTFGFFKDVQKLQGMGLARGGSLDNAIVFDEHRILNNDGFRYNNECVRHKILDFMGDLALAGMPLVGHFQAYKAGHALHNRFLRQLVTTPNNYAVLNFAAPIPTTYLRSPSFPIFPERFSPATKAL